MGVKAREKPKGSGVYWIFIDHKGRRKAKKVGRDKKLANEIARKLEARLVLDDLGVLNQEQKPLLFKALAEMWLSGPVKTTKRGTTYKRYRGLLNMYILPTLKDVEIPLLRRRHVLKVLREMQAKGLSRSSIEQAKNVISGVAEFAIDQEYIENNPTQGVMNRLGMSRKAARKEVEIFSPEEVEHLLQICRQYQPEFYPFLLTAFRSGLRLGELLALKWERINWIGQYMVVSESFRHGKLTATKTNKSRHVDISEQLARELNLLLRQRKEEALRVGTNEVVPVIFHTKGGYTSQNSIRNVWKRVLAKAGLDYRKLHTTRHTYASQLLSAGVPANYVQHQLGHHSIQMTLDNYAHFLPDQNKAAVNVLDTTIRNLSATTKQKNLATL